MLGSGDRQQRVASQCLVGDKGSVVGSKKRLPRLPFEPYCPIERLGGMPTPDV